MSDLTWTDIEYAGLYLEIGYYFDGDGCQIEHVTELHDDMDRDNQTEITALLNAETFDGIAEVISKFTIQDSKG